MNQAKEPTNRRSVGNWMYHTNPIILDTRSPSEFHKGHIPGAQLIPLFEDNERAIIGTIYKHQGKHQAVEKGLEFVAPKMEGMVSSARDLFESQEEPSPLVVHCWRGGMRSGSVAWLLETSGIPVVKLEGGYKAYRQWIRDDFMRISNLRVLGGMTGTGKTSILHEMRNMGGQVLDLEGLAGHLGSAFGNLERTPQPTSEYFGNLCHQVLNGMDWQKPIWVENESRVIGTVHIQQELFDAIRSAPVWTIERSHEERLDELCRVYGDANPEALIRAFKRIRDKLGGAKMQEAIHDLESGGLREAARIGLHYYDKLYLHTKDRYVRKQQTLLDGRGLTFGEIARQLLAVLD